MQNIAIRLGIGKSIFLYSTLHIVSKQLYKTFCSTNILISTLHSYIFMYSVFKIFKNSNNKQDYFILFEFEFYLVMKRSM